MFGHAFDCASQVGGPCTCGDNDPRSDAERRVVVIGNLVGLFLFFALMVALEHCG